MKILNLGSLNIDRVYSVENFVHAKETILSEKMELFCGGKGLNQSIAIARAGAEVYHAGIIGNDGDALRHILDSSGVDTGLIKKVNDFSGHTVIQVNGSGQNCIIVSPGTNYKVDKEYIDEILSDFEKGDILVLQNEVSGTEYAIEAANEKGLKIVFNPSPITEKILDYPLEMVDCFILNEVEGKAMAGVQSDDYNEILDALSKKFPKADIVLTAGKDGVLYQGDGKKADHGIYDVQVVDTTAAGDTFTGYFIAGLVKGLQTEESLEIASAASSLSVGHKGAAESIPDIRAVSDFLYKMKD